MDAPRRRLRGSHVSRALVVRIEELLRSSADAVSGLVQAVAPLEPKLRDVADALHDLDPPANDAVPHRPRRRRARTVPRPTVPFSDVDAALASRALRRTRLGEAKR